MVKVYGDVNSGNCYKVKLTLEQLRQPYDWVEVDILRDDTRQADFLALNPAGKIPVLITGDGTVLSESNAIIWYLAQQSQLMPEGRLAEAEVLQWLFFEQYMHEPNIASARFIKRYLGNPADRKAELEAKIEKGYQALAVMEKHLAERAFFVSGQYSIADIALFAYTHVADEGGFSLGDFPHISRWIDKVMAQDGHIAIG